jgi:hypothetical protein
MKKIKLFGLGDEGNRSYFVFEKTLDFFPLFSKFLSKFEIEKTISFHEYEEKALNLEDITDISENTKNEYFDIDIFYGKEKIFVVIRTELPREKYFDVIKSISEFKGFE